MVKPHLEYHVLFWSPLLTKDNAEVGKSTEEDKLNDEGLEWISNKERLKSLRICRLEKKGLKCGLECHRGLERYAAVERVDRNVSPSPKITRIWGNPEKVMGTSGHSEIWKNKGARRTGEAQRPTLLADREKCISGEQRQCKLTAGILPEAAYVTRELAIFLSLTFLKSWKSSQKRVTDRLTHATQVAVVPNVSDSQLLTLLTLFQSEFIHGRKGFFTSPLSFAAWIAEL